MTETQSILANHPFLKGMSQKHLEIIGQGACVKEFAPQQFLMREGKEASQCFLIQNGRIVVEIFSPGKGPIILQTLGPGDVLGWSWIDPPFRWKFDAWVTEKTTAVQLDGVFLRKRCEEDFEFGYHLLRRWVSLVIQRLDAARLQLLDVYG